MSRTRQMAACIILQMICNMIHNCVGIAGQSGFGIRLINSSATDEASQFDPNRPFNGCGFLPDSDGRLFGSCLFKTVRASPANLRCRDGCPLKDATSMMVFVGLSFEASLAPPLFSLYRHLRPGNRARSRRCLERGLKGNAVRMAPAIQIRGCPCNCKRRARCTSLSPM